VATPVGTLEGLGFKDLPWSAYPEMIQCDQYVQVAYDNKQKRQNLEWEILLLPKN